MDNIITSLSNPKVKKVVELHRKKGRKQHDAYIVEGFHLIEEGIQHSALFEMIFIEEGVDCPSVDCPIYIVTTEIMNKIATTDTPQPILGVVQKKVPKKSMNKQVIYLDDIQDPGNFGTIIRSSVAFGVTHIVASPHCVDLFDSKVVRAAQGAHFQITYDICDEKLLLEKYTGYEIIVTTLDESVPVEQITPQENWVLVVGNEGSGVKKSIQQSADARIQIISPGMESLNVSVATGICLYELTKK